MNLNRRFVLTGLITAPMIVRPTSIMPIFNIDDWDPYVLAFDHEIGQVGWASSIYNSDVNDNKFNYPMKNETYDLLAGRSLQQKAALLNKIQETDFIPISRLRYETIRKSQLAKEFKG